jgi:TusE/DsrC/DsvC family sulfur relay protein
MSTLQCGSKKIEVDHEGFLMESEEWDENVALTIARNEGIDDLGQGQMDIIQFMREYHGKHHSFPILSYVCRNVNAKRRDCVAQEFVDPMKAWKIAGLPKPPNIFFNSFDGKKYTPNPFY